MHGHVPGVPRSVAVSQACVHCHRLLSTAFLSASTAPCFELYNLPGSVLLLHPLVNLSPLGALKVFSGCVQDHRRCPALPSLCQSQGKARAKQKGVSKESVHPLALLLCKLRLAAGGRHSLSSRSCMSLRVRQTVTAVTCPQGSVGWLPLAIALAAGLRVALWCWHSWVPTPSGADVVLRLCCRQGSWFLWLCSSQVGAWYFGACLVLPGS